MLLVLLVREPVRRHFGARVAYGLWLIPAARLLMPTLTETIERPPPAPAPILPAVGAPELSHLGNFIGWPIVLLGLWLIGALALFITRLIQFRRQRRAILSDAGEIGRAGSIRIVRSGAVAGPVAFGIFDRVVAVPIDFESRYSEHERGLALNHELAHHRSGDLIANFVAFALLCLQWFNPLAWVAHAAFRFDQEAACDARVLDEASNSRGTYGRAIAKAASGRALLFAGALDRHSTLERRLKCMLSNPPAARRVAGRLLVVTALAAALPLTATRAINYVDSPAPNEFAQPTLVTTATPLAPDATVKRPFRIQSDKRHSAQGREYEVVPDLAGVQLDTQELAQPREDQQQARKDVEQAQRDQEQARTIVSQAQRVQAQGRDKGEQAQREQAQARRIVAQAQRDQAQARRAVEQAQRVVAQAQRDVEQRRRDFQQVQEQARRSEQQAREQYLRDIDRARRGQERNDNVVRIDPAGMVIKTTIDMKKNVVFTAE
jgi:beta-lactamase regulating signal transducer with metallopeptidase domain